MILSGLAIKEAVEKKDIIITPFDEKNLGPNSYNITLSNKIKVYTDDPKRRTIPCPEHMFLDMKKEHYTIEETMDEEKGYLLFPNRVYLGTTNEYTATNKYVPMIEGRSSCGRLGLFIHITAGFGDIGFAGHWVLEIVCIHPTYIYPNVPIGQIYYHTIEGEYDLYKGKYQNQPINPTESRFYQDFNQ